MDTQTIQVANDSSSIPIYVAMNSPENANISQPPTSPIPAKSMDKIAVKDGTMNMFVWTDVNADPMWKGIVPTKVRKIIVVSPEDRKVTYDGIELPEGFNPVTDPSKPGFSMEERSSGVTSTRWWTYFIVAILAILLLFGILWYFGRGNSKTKKNNMS